MVGKEEQRPIVWPNVAIIVLTWNQRDLTLDCLASLQRLEYPADRLRLIVVDNGSTDGTATLIQNTFPDVTVLVNDENLGFAEGNNVGIRHALETDVDYIMLLNNDTVVDPAMLTELVSVAESDDTIGMVGPKMLYYDQPDVVWCAGNRINWRNGGTIRMDADLRDEDSTRTAPEQVDFVTACALCVRRKVIEEVGLLDSRFFIYYEETDWCCRARSAGWRVVYVPTARLWHKVSAAMGTTSPATDYYMHRNVFLFLQKNAKGLRRTVAILRAALRNAIAIAAYTVKPHRGSRLANRNARLYALRDALLGRWGRMPKDVEQVCYPDAL